MNDGLSTAVDIELTASLHDAVPEGVAETATAHVWTHFVRGQCFFSCAYRELAASTQRLVAARLRQQHYRLTSFVSRSMPRAT